MRCCLGIKLGNFFCHILHIFTDDVNEMFRNNLMNNGRIRAIYLYSIFDNGFFLCYSLLCGLAWYELSTRFLLGG